MKTLVTGPTGFIGSALVARLLRERRFGVCVAARRDIETSNAAPERIVVGDLVSSADWGQALSGRHAVVHLAARVHVTRERAADPLKEFRRVNVAGTMNLASQAAAAGVKRFVFVSSIAVNGKSGICTENDVPAPLNPYGISKHEAEEGLRRIASSTGMEVVIIRPPLVYGRGAKANFHTLMRAVGHGIPLPLGALHNRRSLVGLDNLVDFILTCLEHPAAANEIFLVRDGEDLSTTDFIRRLGNAMNRPARLIPVPAWLLVAGAGILGKRDVAQRLLGSLQIDDSKARRVLEWSSPISVDEGLRRASYRWWEATKPPQSC